MRECITRDIFKLGLLKDVLLDYHLMFLIEQLKGTSRQKPRMLLVAVRVIARAKKTRSCLLPDVSVPLLL